MLLRVTRSSGSLRGFLLRRHSNETIWEQISFCIDTVCICERRREALSSLKMNHSWHSGVQNIWKMFEADCWITLRLNELFESFIVAEVSWLQPSKTSKCVTSTQWTKDSLCRGGVNKALREVIHINIKFGFFLWLFWFLLQNERVWTSKKLDVFTETVRFEDMV